jgi:hypothetical protein
MLSYSSFIETIDDATVERPDYRVTGHQLIDYEGVNVNLAPCHQICLLPRPLGESPRGEAGEEEGAEVELHDEEEEVAEEVARITLNKARRAIHHRAMEVPRVRKVLVRQRWACLRCVMR